MNGDLPFDAETISLVEQILQAQGGLHSSGTPLTSEDINKYLRVYLTIKRNPWLPYAAVGGAMALLIGVGYYLGRE